MGIRIATVANTYEFDLSVIVPVYNCEDSIENLVRTIFASELLNIEVILVDDQSTDKSLEVASRLEAEFESVTTLVHHKNMGAGVARNTGFSIAKGKYTLFFDGDDILHVDAVEDAVDQMKNSNYDIAFLPYIYRRSDAAGTTEMNTADVGIWAEYLKGKRRASGTLSTFPKLLGFSNYPWNKIVLTDRYRANGLRFGATRVNNDILGHWFILLFSENILLLDRVICTHIVYSGGTNLTNQHSNVRFDLFLALEETYMLLSSDPMLRQRYSHHFWGFVLRVSKWAKSRIAPDMREEFNYRLRSLIRKIDLEDYSRMLRVRSPQIARELSQITLS